jgi:hypothetical protein
MEFSPMSDPDDAERAARVHEHKWRQREGSQVLDNRECSVCGLRYVPPGYVPPGLRGK